VSVNGQAVSVKGPKGALEHQMHPLVTVEEDSGVLKFSPRQDVVGALAQTGTARALVTNMMQGVSEGFEKKLELVGVGYRAQAQGKTLNLTLGFSHPVAYPVPEGITIETPSATEIVVKGSDKQLVGQVSAEIRAFRPPEPYKGKGVKYSDEIIVRKEAKKK
jgi:large subunit ribosomal protein L6